MAYATDADLILRIPGASSVDPAVRSAALSDAQNRIDDAMLLDRSVEGHCYVAAHIIAVRTGDLGGESPAVTSKKAAEISITYAAGAAASVEDLSRTKWGREYMTLLQTVAVYPVAIL